MWNVESQELLPYNPEIIGINYFPNKNVRSRIFKVRNGEREKEKEKVFKKLDRKKWMEGLAKEGGR